MGQGKNKGRSVRPKKLHKSSKSERKKARSPGGFLGLIGGFFSLCAWTLWGTVKSEREKLETSKSIRTRLASKPIVFSEHAACRMDCRFVGKKEVFSLLQNGNFSKKHSNPEARPCPRYALEEGRVRGVFADCYNTTPVVTIIDTVTNHPCPPC
mmetsp:Transcript_13610/g.23033  ORF Transcript_13610/g.23033 Transcript_13610/m.23033 type:complete len:154 (-) Transcript_13610:427-888(-)